MDPMGYESVKELPAKVQHFSSHWLNHLVVEPRIGEIANF